jgi:hypothetical protein
MSTEAYLAFLDEARTLFGARQHRFGEISSCRL